MEINNLNKNIKNTKEIIIIIWKLISIKNKQRLFKLLILIFFTATLELISIGSIFPFLGVLIAPEKFYSQINDLGFDFEIINKNNILLFITVIFVIISLLVGGFRLLLMWYQQLITTEIGIEFSSKVYENTLYQPYIYQINLHSSQVQVGLQKTMFLVEYIINPCLLLLSSVIILSLVLIGFMFIDPNATFVTLSVFLVFYFSISLIYKKKLAKNSLIISKNQNIIAKLIQESLGGIREIIINSLQKKFINQFKISFKPLQKSQSENLIIGQSPRYIIEALGMAFISVIAYNISTSSNYNEVNAVPILGVIALAAQRLLPIIQQIYYSIAKIRGSISSISDVIELLCLINKEDNIIKNKIIKEITIKNLYFKYPVDKEWKLKDINLKISVGSTIGIVGPSGSGKSTLINIISGLLYPNAGQIYVDDYEVNENNINLLRSNISYVPQSLFLSDSTIVENIAFGINKTEIDMGKILEVAKISKIEDMIQDWPLKYDTLVGESGVKISGGQRQRIGIARALYKDSNIILLDESTSALDVLTEDEIINSLISINRKKIIIIITHRLSSLKHCDNIFEIKNGSLNKL